ncbi:F-box only protein 9 [Hondaea fermentalgiana]|uniref:F-box only protein 9 n=1 Tax=Hondaea fermentalgiana TaxID=2315210 RepID=A0A2R5GVK1_9STRA|nr:F-box only protein 9 [Hondaea fermentalgiana]|eukprot:GBG32683.1 F-box only protein 9 [Hondaea fermentalgiana]
MSSKTPSLARALEEYQESEALRIAGLDADGATAAEASNRASGPSAGPRSAHRADVEPRSTQTTTYAPRPAGGERLRAVEDEADLETLVANGMRGDTDTHEESPEMVLEQLGARNVLVDQFSSALRRPEDDEANNWHEEGATDNLLPRFWLRKGLPLRRTQQPKQEQEKDGKTQRQAKSSPASSRGVVVVEDDDDEEEEPADLGDGFRDLPADIVLRILYFLDEDALDLMRVCNPAWEEELRAEALWRQFCERIFVPPAFRPVRTVETSNGAIVPAKFMSWEKVRRLRPRVRPETGVYILKSTYIRTAGPRTLWSPEDYKAVLEMRHYRYLLFKPDGQVLYASTPFAPAKMRPKFKQKLFEDWVTDGVARQVVEMEEDGENEGEGQAEGKTESGVKTPAAPNKPVEKMTRRKRAELLRLQRQKLDTTRGDVIHTGLYTVSNGVVSVVINLVRYTVTFDLKLHPRGGSHDILQTVKHQSVYHKEGERIVDYKLSGSVLERLWNYYAFSDPSDPS